MNNPCRRQSSISFLDCNRDQGELANEGTGVVAVIGGVIEYQKYSVQSSQLGVAAIRWLVINFTFCYNCFCNCLVPSFTINIRSHTIVTQNI